MDRLTDATLLSGLRIIAGVAVIIVAGSVAKAALYGDGNTTLHWLRVIGAVLVAIAMVAVASSIFSGYLRLGF